MGFFTSFKPISSWSVPELMDEWHKLKPMWRASVLNGNSEQYERRINDIENEFKRRGLDFNTVLNNSLR